LLWKYQKSIFLKELTSGLYFLTSIPRFNPYICSEFKPDMYTKKTLFPVYIALALAIGLLLGYRIQDRIHNNPAGIGHSNNNPIDEVVNLIRANYVDPIEQDKLYGAAISKMLEGLDPHSVFISGEEMQGVEEEMQGNFEGIGIEFYIQNDTIQVVTPLSGGPSEQLGIQSGDKIIMINDTLVAGVKIANLDVMKKLKGPKGTKVKVTIQRINSTQLTDYTITRNQIPLISVDAGFMLDVHTGYIKINKFSATTYIEFMDKALPLLKQGMKQMVLDLRQNPGGYLGEATKLADEFLDDKKEIVYTAGRNFPKQYYKAEKTGDFEEIPIVVLIDEGSASASEIIAGALQDWDRGLVIGRRSFGKGLVQEQYPLMNGSAIRLTVAKYYTPSGRCIQKSYEEGLEAYYEEMSDRFVHGEVFNKDSINNKTDNIYKTKLLKRTVYGGGGITPDIFIPLDTSYFNPLTEEVLSLNLLTQFTYSYFAANKGQFSSYHSATEFDAGYQVSNKLYNSFIDYAISNGVNEASLTYAAVSRKELSHRMKAFFAKQIWKTEGLLRVLVREDEAVQRALKELSKNPLTSGSK